jgi:Isochorismatase family
MPLPTRENSAILFLDLQQEIIKNSRTLSIERLGQTAGALSKLAALHQLPVFVSAVPPGGPVLAPVLAPLHNVAPRMRTQTSAFADTGLVEALRLSGRQVLVLAGVASEIVVQRTALEALAADYVVQVAVDACGGIDARTEEAAWRRICGAGGVTTSALTFAAELAGDFSTELGGATLAIVYEMLGASAGFHPRRR